MKKEDIEEMRNLIIENTAASLTVAYYLETARRPKSGDPEFDHFEATQGVVRVHQSFLKELHRGREES